MYYFGSRISDNLIETPEGYLVCRGVPVGRTGKMTYLGEELGMQDTEFYDVFREDAEVFSPASMASFEGKPVTDNHPRGDVDAANFRSLACGHIQNVRRGKGDRSHMLIADLHIHDSSLKKRILSGDVREVSCGYTCRYETNDSDGKIYQKEIRGNHVAVVKEGRAGSDVRIYDSAENTSGVTGMKEKLKKVLALYSVGLEGAKTQEDVLRITSDTAHLLGLSIKDSDPEVVPSSEEDEASSCEEDKPKDEMPKEEPEKKSSDEEMPKEEKSEEDEDPVGEASLKTIYDLLWKVYDLVKVKSKDEKPDQKEEELKDEIVPGEEGKEEDEEPPVSLSEAEKEEIAKEVLKWIGPAISEIKDSKDRAAVKDGIARVLSRSDFSGLLRTREQNSEPSSGLDVLVKKQQDVFNSRNPHSKNQ